MRELKLKYFIDLVSNIREKAGDDAKALTQAQDKIQKALGETEKKLGTYERFLMRIGGVHNSSLDKQAKYFSQIALSAARAQQSVEKYERALSGANKVLQGATGFGAGLAGAGLVAKAGFDKPMDYDTRLRYATSTAYAGAKDVNELRAGYAQINELINGTVRSVRGARRDDTLGAYEKLMGSGTFGRQESATLLPAIMRTSVASGAGSKDLIDAAEKMKGSFGLAPEQIELALAKLMRAGQEGGFEIKDSAKWIGPMAPMFKGYKGMAGLEAMVTMLQQVRSTAGSNDQAANNLQNFMQKIPADSTRKNFAQQGIDLTAEMAKGAASGRTPVDTYMSLLDRVMAKQDPEGKARAAMKAADKSLSPEERAQRYSDVAEIYKSAGISTIINDIQEFGGYSGLAKTRDYGVKTLGAVQGEAGKTVDIGYQFLSEGTGSRAVDLANRKDIAASDALEGIAGPLNTLMDKTVALSDEFPKTTAAAYAATVALGALAAASTAAALLGGGGVAGKVGGWIGGAATRMGTVLGAARVAGGAGVGMAAGGAAIPIAAAAGALGVGYAGGTILNKTLLEGTSFSNGIGRGMHRVASFFGSEESTRALAAEDAMDKMNSRPLARLNPVSISAPRGAAGGVDMTAGLGSGRLDVGQGTLGIDVRVTDERVTAVPRVLQQPSLIRLNPGATNPGGLR